MGVRRAVRRDGGPPGHDPRCAARPAVATASGLARRSRAAKQAAETRRGRREREVYDIARRIVAGHVYGPRTDCVVCGRGIEDPESVERGIGSDCWQGVLSAIAARRAPAHTG